MLFLECGKTLSWNGYSYTYFIFYTSICFIDTSYSPSLS